PKWILHVNQVGVVYRTRGTKKRKIGMKFSLVSFLFFSQNYDGYGIRQSFMYVMY
ncbi:hypothetical protein MKW98_015861, partial [Papaver atlanticum]